MSHLTTIIHRVERRLATYGGDAEKAGEDPMFVQAVHNLQEYQQAWKDATPEEIRQADILYTKYIMYCGG